MRLKSDLGRGKSLYNLQKAENDLAQVQEANLRLQSELKEKSDLFEAKQSDFDLLTLTNSKSESQVQELKVEIQKIDSKNRELESKLEEIKIETIKERNQQNEKFEIDKNKLIDIAKQLEIDIEKLQKELEESEEQSSERLGNG